MKGLGNKKVLGENLRMYVNRSGKKDKDVAQIAGVSPATFSEWINGKKYPRIDKIEILADYFHIKKSDLIEEHTQTSGMITISMNEKLARRLLGLSPRQLERVSDFVAGLQSDEVKF